MMSQPDKSDTFRCYARDVADPFYMDVERRDGRAEIRIIGGDTIALTRIQTEELGAWLAERAPRRE